MTNKGFASDNNAGVHPDVLQKLAEINKGHCVGYGDDVFTSEAITLLKNNFGTDVDPYLVLTGTGANTLVIKTLLQSYQAVVCASTAHINVDECAAPEHYTGCKLINIPTEDGKIRVGDIEPLLHAVGFEHHAQPKLISISNCTELGTVYTTDEIKTLCNFAHNQNMLVHVDGARLANAAVSLAKGFREITFDCGVDAVSFGGTKNGLLMGEVVLFRDKELGSAFKYIRKQGMQLYSKMRYISGQFIAYFNDDLWRKNALIANTMAQKLENEIKGIKGVEITMPVQANGVFVKIPHKVAEKLQKEYFFYDWDYEKSEYRWMTSWDTTETDINGFIKTLKKLLKEHNVH